MNESFIFAFVVMPVLVVALGYVAVLLHERDLRRRREKTPAE